MNIKPQHRVVSPNTFSQHMYDVGKKYQCKVCDKKYTDTSALLRHKKSAHEGVTYKCETCEYQCTEKSNLSSHIKSLHEGVKYPC